jgi:hypothetical protein
LFILKKERNLALKKTLVEEKVKVDKLTLDLSSANDSLKSMSKEASLINDSFVNLKNAHSELQARHSSLEVKYKDLEANFDTLLKNAKTNSKTTHDPNVSTSEGCSRCYSIDIKSCVTNLVKLEEKVKAKDSQIRDLNKLVDMSKAKGKSVFESHPAYKAERYPSIKDGLGFTRGGRSNGTRKINGYEVPLFKRGTNLGELMNIAHGTSRANNIEAKPLVKILSKVAKDSTNLKEKEKIIERKPSSNYTIDYTVMWDQNGKMVVKYVGAHAKKMMRSVWVPKMSRSNPQGPNLIWVPKIKI